MTAKFRTAEDVAKIAADLIETVPQHEDLGMARIEYVFIQKHVTSHGRWVLARASKVGGLHAFIAAAFHLDHHVEPTPFYVIEVAEDTWTGLSDEGRRALVDHELCHLHVSLDEDGEPVLGMRGHDLEEFEAIIRRHGLWKDDIRVFSAAVAEQLSLPIPMHVTGFETIAARSTGPVAAAARPVHRCERPACQNALVDVSDGGDADPGEIALWHCPTHGAEWRHSDDDDARLAADRAATDLRKTRASRRAKAHG